MSDEKRAQSGLPSRSELRQIKKSRVRRGGKRVVTDDVNKLKSITIEPHLPEGDYVNYYVEPVRIEYYVPKESKFVVEIKYLYIPLVDPVPRTEPDDRLLREAMEANRFFDVVEVMNNDLASITKILESYGNTLTLFEALSREIREAEAGDVEKYRAAFYICEALVEYEPTLVSLELFGEFYAWNLNWLVRQMNTKGVEFSASDKTISYFIKLRNQHWEENNLPEDERFDILEALFYQQAFPNRGMEGQKEDYFHDIFEH